MISSTRFIDLSHSIEDGMKAYPGFPSPKIQAFLTREDSRPHYDGKAEFYIGKVEMVGNVGTYLDSPFHRHAKGLDLSQIPLESIAGVAGIVMDGKASADGSIMVDCDGSELREKSVLIRTGWDERWGTERYWQSGPYLSDEFIDLLVRSKARLVGVDFWNIDNVENKARPAHTRFLGANIVIVEHLANLSTLPRTGFRFYAVPPPIVNGASFPVRAFAEI
ncbi:MAG: cyclase family protein [Candidatus Bathyarchaeia archaeon]|jgi:kynurenine formamidase